MLLMKLQNSIVSINDIDGDPINETRAVKVF